ncbi:unnamed protein product [Protopolystoma xenopodis]|uniref:Uncharacterized protein n=1 Tax=Protopolystoma xenopodis TaxID=117903 RepID=A0A3S5AL06_9PLAT|nr:unnamed protein product [Protopolystoma xenopodis]
MPFVNCITGSDKVTLRLDTRVGLWQRLPDPEFAHAFLPIVPISGQIYAAGGGVVQLERFDPASNSWTTLAAMKEE